MFLTSQPAAAALAFSRDSCETKTKTWHVTTIQVTEQHFIIPKLQSTRACCSINLLLMGFKMEVGGILQHPVIQRTQKQENLFLSGPCMVFSHQGLDSKITLAMEHRPFKDMFCAVFDRLSCFPTWLRLSRSPPLIQSVVYIYDIYSCVGYNSWLGFSWKTLTKCVFVCRLFRRQVHVTFGGSSVKWHKDARCFGRSMTGSGRKAL